MSLDVDQSTVVDTNNTLNWAQRCSHLAEITRCFIHEFHAVEMKFTAQFCHARRQHIPPFRCDISLNLG
jgi:hypothetical protein